MEAQHLLRGSPWQPRGAVFSRAGARLEGSAAHTGLHYLHQQPRCVSKDASWLICWRDQPLLSLMDDASMMQELCRPWSNCLTWSSRGSSVPSPCQQSMLPAPAHQSPAAAKRAQSLCMPAQTRTPYSSEGEGVRTMA